MLLPRVLPLLIASSLLFSTTSAVDKVDVEWKDVSFSVGRGKKKAILDGVSGRANAGKVLAVMGPSGSGKTTLLNALAGQVPYSKRSQLHGTLTVGGAERAPDQEQAFVKQEDVFYSQLTVRETLLMAARLRLPSSVPLEEKSAMVDKLISKLGLSKVASTIVGDEKTRGISGGEKKRLSIACQLFGTPSLIFCDEPTTGLDAFQAERVMATLRQLAQDGHTVICSIHQPRSSIYGMFDDVLLLSEGRVMFQGPAKRIGSYFRSKGYPMPSHTNPGDFAVDVVSVDYTSKKTERRTKERIARFDAEHRASAPTSSSSSSSSSSLLSYFVSHWEKTGGEATEDEDEEEEGENKQKQKEKEKEEVTEVAETAAAAAAAVVKGGATSSKAAAQRRGKATQRKGKAAAKRGSKAAAKKGSKAVQRRSGDGEKRAGAMEQFRLLLARSWRQVNRAKFANATRVVANLGSALVFGSIFWKLGMGQSHINDRIGLLQTSVIQTAMSTVAKTLVTFPKEATIVKAERSLNMYSVLPYFLAKMIADLPLTALFPTVSGAVMYKMTGLHPKRDRLAKFLGVLTLEAFAAAAFGMLVGCVAKDGDAANAIGPPLMTIFILFSGFYITQDNVPRCLWWLKDASMIKQAFEALCVNELKGLEFECDNKSRGPCIRTGEQMLERVAFGESTVEGATIGLSKILGSCWAFTYLALVLGKPRFQTMLDPSLLAGKASSAGGAAVSVSGGGGNNSGLLDGGVLAAGEGVNTGEVVENHDGSPDGTVKGSKAWGVVRMLRRRAVSAEHDATSVLKTSGVTGRVAAPMPLRAGK